MIQSDDARERFFARVLLRAVTSPATLFFATAGVLLLPSPEGWPFGVAVLAAGAGWVGWRVRDPALVQRCREELLRLRRQKILARLETLCAQADAVTADALSATLEAQERLQAALGRDGHSRLSASSVELTGLLDQCVSLVERRQRIQRHLSACRSAELQRQARQLEQRLEAAHDPVTRQLYEQALEQKRQELENCEALEHALDRIDGQLMMVRCTFDNLLSRLMRMESGELLAELDGRRDDPITRELHALSGQVEALEASLDEVLMARSGR